MKEEVEMGNVSKCKLYESRDIMDALAMSIISKKEARILLGLPPDRDIERLVTADERKAADAP